MVDSQVRPNDVTELRLQAAMETTPRELFLPPRLRDQAYVERELPYGPARRLITARDFSKLVSAAQIAATDVVLDVACGGGYSAAILARLAERVIALEPVPELAESARSALRDAGVANVEIVAGALAEGAPAQAPFDVIIIAAAVERVPERLFDQLKDGGRLAVIERQGGVSRGVVYSKSGGAVASRASFDAATTFVLPGFAAEKAFAF